MNRQTVQMAPKRRGSLTLYPVAPQRGVLESVEMYSMETQKAIDATEEAIQNAQKSFEEVKSAWRQSTAFEAAVKVRASLEEAERYLTEARISSVQADRALKSVQNMARSEEANNINKAGEMVSELLQKVDELIRQLPEKEDLHRQAIEIAESKMIKYGGAKKNRKTRKTKKSRKAKTVRRKY
jgi:hypothetical protein